VGHARVLSVRRRNGLGRVGAVVEPGRMRVMVGRDGRVRQRCRAAAAATLPRDLCQFFGGCLAGLNVDAGYAVGGIDVNAKDMRILAQTFDEAGTRAAADTADGHAQRDPVISGVVG
jgi:hypothetical protein